MALYNGRGLPGDFAQRNFAQFSGALHSHVDPEPIGEDLTRLTEKADRIRKFANKRIAHFDRSEYKNLPTYAELDDCLDYLKELLRKYLAMLRAESWVRIVPTWQFDWKEVFRHAWIEPTDES